jgi:hypothetical protein
MKETIKRQKSELAVCLDQRGMVRVGYVFVKRVFVKVSVLNLVKEPKQGASKASV